MACRTPCGRGSGVTKLRSGPPRHDRGPPATQQAQPYTKRGEICQGPAVQQVALAMVYKLCIFCSKQPPAQEARSMEMPVCHCRPLCVLLLGPPWLHTAFICGQLEYAPTWFCFCSLERASAASP